MSNGYGVTESQVHAIVRSYVNPLVVRINEMEVIMNNVDKSVEALHKDMVKGINLLLEAEGKALSVHKQSHDMTFEQFVATQARLGLMHETAAQGFSTVQAGLGVVDSSVRQMSTAIVQMEVIRILNEAEDPIDRTRHFATEIDERFGKAVENVYIIRGQYDTLSDEVRKESERKLRTIGEHIYSIYEEDFQAYAELPMQRPPDDSLDVPLLVEEAVLRGRSEALDRSLEAMGRDLLEPLLQAHHVFEHELASRYSIRSPSKHERVAIPVAVSVVQGTGGKEVIGAACATVLSGRDAGGQGVHYRLESKKAASDAWGVGRAVRDYCKRIEDEETGAGGD